MRSPLDCHVCGGPGARDVGTQGYCWAHLAALYETYETRSLNGIGLPVGPSLVNEYGTNVYSLHCSQCEASWVGFIADPCYWCEKSRQIAIEWQREIVLRPPEMEVDDAARPNALRAWAERMEIQVQAGTITVEEAKNATIREIRRTG